MKILMIKIVAIFILFFGCPVYASLTASIGTSINYLNINDPNFHYVDNELKLSNLNLAISYNAEPFVFTASTNRLLLQSDNRKVINKKTGVSFKNETKAKADTFLIGYQIKRFLPQVFISNVNVDKTLYHNNRFVGRNKQSAFVYGVSSIYFYDKNISFSASILAPNQELNLETGIIIGINYNFNLL